jgi:hypothetical protein
VSLLQQETQSAYKIAYCALGESFVTYCTALH